MKSRPLLTGERTCRAPCRRRDRAAPRPPRRQRHGPGSPRPSGRRRRDATPSRRPVRGRHARDGRLRAFPPARDGARRNDAVVSQEQPGAAIPVLLIPGSCASVSSSAGATVRHSRHPGTRRACQPASSAGVASASCGKVDSVFRAKRCAARRERKDGWIPKVIHFGSDALALARVSHWRASTRSDETATVVCHEDDAFHLSAWPRMRIAAAARVRRRSAGPRVTT